MSFRPKLPRGVRDWHSLLGMFFSLVLFYLFVSGTASVFGSELDWLVNRDHRAVPQAQGKLSLGASLDAARNERPGWAVVSVTRMEGARFADQVTVRETGGGAAQLVLVDPYRGTVNGTGGTDTVRQVLREFHRGLSTNSRKVQAAVALMAIPLAAILVTSLILHRKFYRSLFTLPRRGARRRTVLGDLHRLFGAWSLLFMIPLVVTSAYFLVELLDLGPAYYPENRLAVARDAEAIATLTGAGLDRAVEAARAVYPGFDVTQVELPQDPTMPIAVRGHLDAPLVRTTANAVYIDPADFSVTAAHRAEDLGPGLRLFEAMRVVHYGTFAGLPSRLLWLLFGLAMTALAGLGAMIYAERLVFIAERSKSTPERSRLGHYWAGMGTGKWVGLAMIAIAVAMTVLKLT